MTTKQKLEAENYKLRQICIDLQWMARRYADGRSTYAPGIVNDATTYLLSIGVKLKNCAKEGLYANYGLQHKRFYAMTKQTAALQLIQELAENLGLDLWDSKAGKNQSWHYQTASKIFTIAHAASAPCCLKNHRSWDKPIKAYIKKWGKKRGK